MLRALRTVAVAAALAAPAGVSATSSWSMKTESDLMIQEGETQEETLGQHLREFSEIVVGVMQSFSALQVEPAKAKANQTEPAKVEPTAAKVVDAKKTVDDSKPAETKAIKPLATPAELKLAAAKVEAADKVAKAKDEAKKIHQKLAAKAKKDADRKKNHPTKFEFPPELQKLNEQFKKPISHMGALFGGKGGNDAAGKVQQLAIMVPMLEDMYGKFKEDIKSNNKLEKASAARLKQYTDELDEIKKTGEISCMLNFCKNK